MWSNSRSWVSCGLLVSSSQRVHCLRATNAVASLSEADALVICVPTPLTASREPDLSFVINTVESILPHLRAGQLISLESTTYPGTTDEELKPRLEQRGFKDSDALVGIVSLTGN